MDTPTISITSLTNPRIKDLVRLRRHRHRSREGVMIVEEPLVISRGLEAGMVCREVFFCPDNLAADEQPLLHKLQKLPQVAAFELSPPVMAKVAYRDRPQGLLVVAANHSTSRSSSRGDSRWQKRARSHASMRPMGTSFRALLDSDTPSSTTIRSNRSCPYRMRSTASWMG